MTKTGLYVTYTTWQRQQLHKRSSLYVQTSHSHSDAVLNENKNTYCLQNENCGRTKIIPYWKREWKTKTEIMFTMKLEMLPHHTIVLLSVGHKLSGQRFVLRN